MSNVKATSSGIGILGVMFVVFAVLKVLEIAPVASWSWWWVTSPLWGVFVIVPGVIMLVLVSFAIGILVAMLVEAPFLWAQQRRATRDAEKDLAYASPNVDRATQLDLAELYFKRIAVKAHPDRGGSKEAMLELNGAIGRAREELR